MMMILRRLLLLSLVALSLSACVSGSSQVYTFQIEREIIESRKPTIPIVPPKGLAIELIESTEAPNLKITNQTPNIIRLSYSESALQIGGIAYNVIPGDTRVLMKNQAVTDRIIPSGASIGVDFYPIESSTACVDGVVLTVGFKDLEKDKITYATVPWSANYFYDKSNPEMRHFASFGTPEKATEWGTKKYGKSVKIEKMNSRREAKLWQNAIKAAKEKKPICGYKQ